MDGWIDECCNECMALCDDYYVNENGELVCACDECHVNKWRMEHDADNR